LKFEITVYMYVVQKLVPKDSFPNFVSHLPHLGAKLRVLIHQEYINFPSTPAQKLGARRVSRQQSARFPQVCVAVGAEEAKLWAAPAVR
jgi:hypothetical protein